MNTPHDNIWEAISFFEKILETMPDDRLSLEFLAEAYEQTGDANRSRASWQQLAAVLLRNGETDGAEAVRQRLLDHADDPAVATLIARLEALLDGGSAKRTPAGQAAAGATTQHVSRSDIPLEPALLRMAAAFEEVNLAWVLHEQGLIEEDDYEQMTVELTEGGVTEKLPVSALACLHRMRPECSDAAVVYLSGLHGLLPVRPQDYETPEDVRTLLPAVYVRIRGAFPFARLGRNLMVAVLNPADTKLRAEVEALSGCTCTFYLAHPGQIDALTERYKDERERAAAG